MTEEKEISANTPAPAAQDAELPEALRAVERRLVVFSGKGGVGKTTVAVNLAYALAKSGDRVGLLDADITGPNIPQMAGISETVRSDGTGIVPHEKQGVKVVSLASMIPAGTPVIWRGPLRSRALEQFVSEVAWGPLDWLIVDLPPGTGDEVLTIAKRTLPQMAIVVTTPQEVALLDARRAVNMAKKLNIKTVGIVENMSGFLCPHCGGEIDLFGAGSGRREALALGVHFLGPIPIDPRARIGADAGRPIVLEHPDAPMAAAFEAIVEGIRGTLGERDEANAE